jgi:hypothetical protein
MSSNFGRSLWHTIRKLNGFNPHQFPKRITGLWVKELTTAVGDIGNETIDRNLRTSGLWMTLTLEGLGKCEWNDI